MADKVVGKLVYKIVGDDSSFHKTLEKDKQAAAGFGKKVEGSTKAVKDFNKTGGNFQKSIGGIKAGYLAAAGAAIGVVAAVKKVSEITQVWIDAASDAAEINSKYAVTFGDVSASSSLAVRELSKDYGLAESTAKKLLSTTGDLLKGFGATSSAAIDLSQRTQKLAIDQASFNNIQGGATRASEILTKAMLGERDGLIALGIKISEVDVQQKLFEKGQQDLTGQALLLAKAEATLDLAYQQSGNAIGDYARTMESHANIVRRNEEVSKALREELGERLIPTATNVQTTIIALKEEFLNVISATNDLDSAIQKINEGILPDYEEQMALANQGTLELQRSLMEVAQGKFSFKNLRDLDSVMNNLRGTAEELTEEQRRNQTVIENMERISLRNEKITERQVEITRTKAKEEKKVTDELEEQIKLEETRQKEIGEISKEAIDRAKGLEKLVEQRAILAEKAGEEFDKQAYIAGQLADIMDGLVQQSFVFGENTKEQPNTLGYILDKYGHLLDYQNQVVEATHATDMNLRGVATTTETILTLKGGMSEEAYKRVTQENLIAQAIAAQNQKLSEQAQVLSGVGNLWSGIGNLIGTTYDMQLERLEEQGLKEDEFAVRKKEILRNEAIAAKAFALFNAGINTAGAVIAQLAVPGVGVILAGLAAATGALQIAAIAAQPLPQLGAGGVVTQETVAILGEKNKTEGVIPLENERALAMIGDRIAQAIQNSPTNVGVNPTVIVKIGDREFNGYIEKQIDNGQILIAKRSLK